MSERDSPDLLRHAVCGKAIKQGVSVRPFDQNFRECSNVYDANDFAHHFDLCGDDVIDGCAVERIVILLRDAFGKKAWAFEAIDFFLDSAFWISGGRAKARA